MCGDTTALGWRCNRSVRPSDDTCNRCFLIRYEIGIVVLQTRNSPQPSGLVHHPPRILPTNPQPQCLRRTDPTNKSAVCTLPTSRRACGAQCWYVVRSLSSVWMLSNGRSNEIMSAGFSTLLESQRCGRDFHCSVTKTTSNAVTNIEITSQTDNK